jgi:hypothetical protein
VSFETKHAPGLQPHSFGTEAMRRSVSDKGCFSKKLRFLLLKQREGNVYQA